MIGKFYYYYFCSFLWIFKIKFLQMHRSTRQSLDCSQSDVLLFLFVAGHSGYFFLILMFSSDWQESCNCSVVGGAVALVGKFERIWSTMHLQLRILEKNYVSGFYMKCSGSHSVRLPAMLYVNCKLDKSRAFEEQLHMVGDQVDTMVAALSAVAEDTGISIISYSCV